MIVGYVSLLESRQPLAAALRGRTHEREAGRELVSIRLSQRGRGPGILHYRGSDGLADDDWACRNGGGSRRLPKAGEGRADGVSATSVRPPNHHHRPLA